jgi:translocator assembly and maintenance protein 41
MLSIEDKSENSSASGDDGQLTSQSALTKIIQQFPNEDLVHAFGYGSGVFSQNISDSAAKGGMLDIILVVKDAENFHRNNLQIHPHHYATWLRASGASTASWMQRNFLLPDAKVLFHVVDDPVPMKYGVVQEDDLFQDLTEWEYLYLAGRLHKPTLPIITPPDSFLQAQHFNLQAAVAAALLLLSKDATTATTSPHSISWPTFYNRIASLSYTGDFRMQMGGEDPLKITKLVEAPGQLQRFHALYRNDVLKPLEKFGLLEANEKHLTWDPSDPSVHKFLWEQLPPKLQDGKEADMLAKSLAAIVAPAARYQSFKGIFTLGARKSIQYASAKLAKGLLRKR